MSITAQQGALRRQLADTLRADSDAIRDHLRMAEYLASEQDPCVLWSDNYAFTQDDVHVRLSWASSVHPDANRDLNHALRLKIKGLLPQLVREVLDDAAKRAESAVARLVDTAPPDDASTISKVLGTQTPAPVQLAP